MFEILEDPSVEKSVVVTIGLLLPPEQERAAIAISQEIAATEECSFVLEAKSNPPRVRLYETVFPKDDVQEVKARLTKLAHRMIAFPMEWGLDEVVPHFAALWGVLNEPLRLFHLAILEEISPLRHGYYKQKYTKESSEFSDEERRSWERWGSPWAEPYRPHMIIAKAKTQFRELPQIEWGYRHGLFPGILVEVKEPGEIVAVERYLFAEPKLEE